MKKIKVAIQIKHPDFRSKIAVISKKLVISFNLSLIFGFLYQIRGGKKVFALGKKTSEPMQNVMFSVQRHTFTQLENLSPTIYTFHCFSPKLYLIIDDWRLFLIDNRRYIYDYTHKCYIRT